MNAEEKVAAANLADVEPVTAEEWQALPEHKREVRSVFVRLPDPPPVAALRRILELALSNVQPERVVAAVRLTAADALAEFDGTTT